MQTFTPTQIEPVAAALLDGKVAILPTDTVYGLVAAPTHEAAVDRIFELKNRPRDFNLPIMVAEAGELHDLGVEINKHAQALLDSEYIPGGLTLILGFKNNAPRPEWLKGRHEVAIRIPNHDFMLKLLSQTGPLLATSANRHKSKINMCILPEILKDLHSQPDLVVDGGTLSGRSSTIVNCRYKEISMERRGDITIEQIEEVINNG